MIVDCAVYENGRRRDGAVPVHEAMEACRERGAFTWIGLCEPTEEEFDSIRREFDLHELAVEDAIHAHQRPKLEVYGDTVFIVLKTARYIDPEEVVRLGEILIFLGNDFIITVRHGEASELKDVRQGLEEEPELLAHGPGAVLHAIVDEVIDPEVRTYFRDVNDHLLRAHEQLESYRDLLTSVLSANLAQVTVRQNEDVRRISAIVAILAVPTAIAGLYGMNFEHMPELEWSFGYPAVLLVMATICFTLYRYFKRVGWL